MSFNALLISVKENLKLVLSILFDETFNPLRTNDDCSPNKSFTTSDGALKIFGNTEYKNYLSKNLLTPL